MTSYDAFNGDADGIASLVQLRLAEPHRDAVLVTGVKRDIALLERIDGEVGDDVVALDISLDKNRAALDRLLGNSASVLYFDHHYAGDIPDHPSLEAHINTAPEVCTAVLVNEYLGGAYADWAVVGAFGDNLRKTAARLASANSIGAEDSDRLERLGVCLNYNAYGQTIADLHHDPADLFRQLVRFESARDFVASDSTLFRALTDAYDADMSLARDAVPVHQDANCAVIVLPAESWARRASGVYGNELAQADPSRAFAVLTEKSDGGYQVSVRAPLSNRVGADAICRQFETGGGRQAAAGINHLPQSEFDRFVAVVADYYA